MKTEKELRIEIVKTLFALPNYGSHGVELRLRYIQGLMFALTGVFLESGELGKAGTILTTAGVPFSEEGEQVSILDEWLNEHDLQHLSNG